MHESIDILDYIIEIGDFVFEGYCNLGRIKLSNALYKISLGTNYGRSSIPLTQQFFLNVRICKL